MSKQLAMMSTKWRKWTPNESKQRKKLSNKETDWKLPGINQGSFLSRTRGKRKALSKTTAEIFCGDRKSNSQTCPSPQCLFPDTPDRTESQPPAEVTPDNTGAKDPASRAIFEVKSVRALLEKYVTECPNYRSSVQIEFPNCCIATGIRISCTNHPACLWMDDHKPLGANIQLQEGAGSCPLTERTSDYAVNVLFLMSFLASGDGGTEAQRLLGFLALPNATTMEKRSWPELEQRLAPTIHEVALNVLQQNLEAEVLEVFGDEMDDDNNLLFELWKSKQLPDYLYPSIDVSTDMGWQGRSSGKSYTSLSGHAALVGMNTRKPVAKQSLVVTARHFTRINQSTERYNQANMTV